MNEPSDRSIEAGADTVRQVGIRKLFDQLVDRPCRRDGIARCLSRLCSQNEPLPFSEPVGVFRPTRKDEASGGGLNVRVDVWPFNLNPVMLELIGPDNKSLGLRILTISQLTPQLFETTVPYEVSEPTLARLTIRQDDDRMSGLFYVYSQEILLNP